MYVNLGKMDSKVNSATLKGDNAKIKMNSLRTRCRHSRNHRHHWTAAVPRHWATPSACCIQVSLHSSRSSLHRLAGVPCRIVLPHGLCEWFSIGHFLVWWVGLRVVYRVSVIVIRGYGMLVLRIVLGLRWNGQISVSVNLGQGLV